MAKNLEIKCRLNSFDPVKIKIDKLPGFKFHKEKQTDIYYKVKNGRLKLRIINDKTANLIFYRRNENSSKRVSEYFISQTVNFKELDLILRSQFNVLVTVTKDREIFIRNNFRIHLDKVKGLGKFLEIEVIFGSLVQARKQLKKLISELGLDENSFVKVSYSDLLINKK